MQEKVLVGDAGTPFYLLCAANTLDTDGPVSNFEQG